MQRTYRTHLAITPPSPCLLRVGRRLTTYYYRCVIIGIVRFWQIYVINLIGNLTGTSLTTFMLCSIELMLAGLCVNIPMLRPFYLRWRTKHKMSQGGSQAFNQGTGGFKSIRSDPLAENQPAHGPAKHTAWIELVSHFRNRKSSKEDMADTPARMIRNTTRSMMMTVDRSGSSLATSLLPFMFLRTGRWLRLMRFSGSTKSFSVREAARSCGAYNMFLFDSESIYFLFSLYFVDILLTMRM